MNNLNVKEKNTSALLKRNSGVELLKIIAILFIVLLHSIQTFKSNADFTNIVQNSSSKYIDLILTVFGSSGTFGNTIFFVCSAWFLANKPRPKDRLIGKKNAFLIMDTWIVSVIILIIFICFSIRVSGIGLYVKSIFPISFSNNWYITCYILFFAIHPYLNEIMDRANQKRHLRICLVLGSIYLGINFIFYGLFFITELVTWITIYFCISYLKKYMSNIVQSKKINLAFVLMGTICQVLLIFVLKFIDSKVSFFDMDFLGWRNSNNIFLICIAIGLLNLMNSLNFKNKVINKISSTSLLIYLIHENILVREEIRPKIVEYFGGKFGFAHPMFFLFSFAFSVFAVSLLISLIYQQTIQKLTKPLSSKLFDFGMDTYERIEKKFIKE